MKQSTGRILTTHAGRLDGPPDLMQTSRDVMAGRAIDAKELQPRLRNGIADVIRKQVEAGIDVISDGELTKFGFGSLAYYGRRLNGLGKRPLKPGEAPYMALETNERREFAEFYKELQFLPAPSEPPSAQVRSPTSGKKRSNVISSFSSLRWPRRTRRSKKPSCVCLRPAGWSTSSTTSITARMKSTCSLWRTRSNMNTKRSLRQVSSCRSMILLSPIPTT